METKRNVRTDGPSPWIDGFITRRFEAGERPNYDYPMNHVPEAPNLKEMKVVTGFIAGRKKKK